MNCASFEEIVHSLVRYELLDLDVREQSLTHAESCAACGSRLASAQALADATEFARASLYAEQAPVRTSAAILAEFQRAHAPKHFGLHVARWALAMAATLALAYGAWFGYEHFRAGDRVQNPGPSQVSTAPVEANLGSAAAPAAAAESPDSNLLADFQPVPFAGDFDPSDPAMIVHVQLTRAALGKLGYEVEKGKGKELVEADVLVGVDGWPRAVRVSQ